MSLFFGGWKVTLRQGVRGFLVTKKRMTGPNKQQEELIEC